MQKHTSGGRALPSDRADQPEQRLQITFTKNDAMHAMKYRDMVDSHTNGWRTCELLLPGIDDAAWFEQWCNELDRASGCLVVFTRSYRARVRRHAVTALRMEADAILKRVRQDAQFKVFVLDPSCARQDYANLKLFLELGVESMQVEPWREFLARQPQEGYNEDENHPLDSWRDAEAGSGIVQAALRERSSVQRQLVQRGEGNDNHAPMQLLVCFTPGDKAHAEHYKDMVNLHTSGWRLCELTVPHSDAAASAMRNDLNRASGCLVVFTQSYRSTANIHRRSGLRTQATAVLKRAKRDRHFKLFVLDPSCVGQDYANLNLYLELNVSRMNVQLLSKFIATWSQPTPCQLHDVGQLHNQSQWSTFMAFLCAGGNMHNPVGVDFC